MTATRVPRRIQRKRTPGWKLPDGAVDVAEGKWANPFTVGVPVGRDSDLWPWITSLFPSADELVLGAVKLSAVTLQRAGDVAEAHFRWFLEQPELMLIVADELGGRDLACTCRPGAPCHGDTLLLAARGWEE